MLAAGTAAFALSIACGEVHRGAGPEPLGVAGTENAGASSADAGSNGAGGQMSTCTAEGLPPKRIARLSFNQISNTIHALFGEELGQAIDLEYEIGAESAVARTFPPLASPREGSVISTSIWPTNDRIANAVGRYVLDHLDAVTGCGAAPTEACARSSVQALAEKMYRRPLTAEEVDSVMQTYEELQAIHGTVPEAIQYTVYALAQSPQLLYRTELGTEPSLAGPLTSYELASELSYFLTDGPPDRALLDAAERNELASNADIGAQVDRLLATSTARKNLESALFSYFKLDYLMTVKLDDVGFTTGTSERPYTGLRESAYHESQLFLANTLWSGPLRNILTEKKSWLNTTLAAFYGVPLAPQPADETTFLEAELPANRGGLLTQVGYLASSSLPDRTSVVRRGMIVNAALLCVNNPPLPTDTSTLTLVEDEARKLAMATSREQAEFRMTTEPCASCHSLFDPFGLALETYDVLGRYRTLDSERRPIDPVVKLPASAGGGLAKDAMDMEEQIAQAPAFARCVTRNMFSWALAEGYFTHVDGCPVRNVADAWSAGEATFSDLLRRIATSETFVNRRAAALDE